MINHNNIIVSRMEKKLFYLVAASNIKTIKCELYYENITFIVRTRVRYDA